MIRDYGIGRRHSGDFLPAHIGTAEQGHPPLDPPGAATFRCGPEQLLRALEDSEADYCRLTRRSNGYVMLTCKGCANAAYREFGALAGYRIHLSSFFLEKSMKCLELEKYVSEFPILPKLSLDCFVSSPLRSGVLLNGT